MPGTTIYEIDPNEVSIISNRQRKFFDPKDTQELADSIKSIGQLQPGLCRRDEEGNPLLIFGERRLRACKLLNQPFRTQFKEDITDPALLYEIELMENIMRKQLTWQEEVAALAEYHKFQQSKYGVPTIGREGGHAVEDTAETLHMSKGIVSEDITLAMFAEAIPEVAQAKNKTEAKKIIKRLKNEVERHQLLETARAGEEAKALEEGGTGVSSQELRLKDYAARTILSTFEDWAATYAGEPFDVVLFDPPWGVDFDKVKLNNVGHMDYEDSKEDFYEKLDTWLRTIWNIMAEDSHLYLFFGMANYSFVYETARKHGFTTNGIPIIWQKQGAHRTRNPTIWPGRSYEPILYARKGSKPLAKQGAPDVITTPQPTPKIKQIHPSAKHPSIYRELLMRSAMPGDRVLDPMAGSGMAAVACDALKQSMYLDWTIIEKEEHFRNLALYNLYQGYFKIVDDVEGEDPEDKEYEVIEEDFRKFEPGSKEWMNYWRLNPHKQDEMLAFRKEKQ